MVVGAEPQASPAAADGCSRSLDRMADDLQQISTQIISLRQGHRQFSGRRSSDSLEADGGGGTPAPPPPEYKAITTGERPTTDHDRRSIDDDHRSTDDR